MTTTGFGAPRTRIDQEKNSSQPFRWPGAEDWRPANMFPKFDDTTACLLQKEDPGMAGRITVQAEGSGRQKDGVSGSTA
jgi:hypothetical protein